MPSGVLEGPVAAMGSETGTIVLKTELEGKDEQGRPVLELALDAGLDELAAIRHQVERAGRALGLGPKALSDLCLAVDEAVTNIVEHAYGGKGGQVVLSLSATDDVVKVVLRDWGEAFEPQAVPMPDVDAPLDQRQVGGLGLFLMRQVMDSVCFNFDRHNGNQLTMIKRREGGKA
jgi:serine/threonine-protein kinase RsbW